MKGALACYVEAVRALQDAGVRLRGDVLIAAVCGEIEKTQYGDAQGARVPRLRGRHALPRHARRRRRHVPARRADRGQGRARALRLALAADLAARRLHPHGVQRGPARPQLDPADARGARRGARVDPDVGGRPRERVPRREGDRQRRRDPGRLRLARLADAAPDRPLPRRPRAADEADGASRGGEVLDLVRGLARAVPRLRHRGRGLRDRAGRRDRGGPRAGRGDRRGARGGVRRAAGPRRHALVQRRVGADALRDRRRSTTARPPG